MDMQISGSNSAASLQSQNSFAANWQQRQHNFKDLMTALQSGDLSAAQSAYAALTGTSDPNSTSANDTSKVNGASASAQTSPLAQIGQALKSGDLAGAQKAAQTLASAHGHHHHRHSGGSAGASTPAPTSTSSIEDTIGSLINTAA
jgi:hypothetical protein